MEALKHRVLTLGELPSSEGGIYNPGAIQDGNNRLLLVRHEKDYGFTNDVHATLITGTLNALKEGVYEYKILKRNGFPKDTRLEDFRLFMYKEELYCTCTFVFGWNGSSTSPPKSITPIICKITEDEIILFDHLDIPLKRKSTEKNWQVFVFNDELYCIYSLDPLIIFKHIGFSWKLVKEEENGLNTLIQSRLPGAGYLSLSAMTQWNEFFMLGFWHTYVNGVIQQGVFILDMNSLDITEFTPPIIDGSEWNDGYKKGICYVSGLIKNEETLEIWCGEADSHTSMLEISTSELSSVLVNSPFKKQTPLKICFRDAGLGDFICAMYAVQGWLDANPDNSVVLYIWQHFEIASVLKMPRVKIVQYSDQKSVIDLTSNENQSEYHEKLLFGDYKKWYGLKMGSSLSKPDVSHIKEKEEYKDCIVLAPFSAWSNRSWNIKYWKLLSEMLVQQGHHVVIIDPHTNRCKELNGELHTERSLMEDFKVIKSAKLLIGNDSGLSHVAGLLGTPCLVLSGWLNPEAVYSNTDVKYIWNQETKDHIRNLNNITVDDVMAKLKEML